MSPCSYHLIPCHIFWKLHLYSFSFFLTSKPLLGSLQSECCCHSFQEKPLQKWPMTSQLRKPQKMFNFLFYWSLCAAFDSTGHLLHCLLRILPLADPEMGLGFKQFIWKMISRSISEEVEKNETEEKNADKKALIKKDFLSFHLDCDNNVLMGHLSWVLPAWIHPSKHSQRNSHTSDTLLSAPSLVLFPGLTR